MSVADATTRALRRLYRTTMRSDRLRRKLYEIYSAEGYADLWQHEHMLADRVRVDAYAAAIERGIGPDDVVLDVGTGSGILSLLAARQARKVYAIDHGDFIAVARRMAALHGVGNVEFLQVNSREFEPPEPISVVLHEQMGDELINEDMVANLLDLRRVLRDGGRFLPARFELFVEPVELHPEARVPLLWELDLHGISYAALEHDPVISPFVGERHQHHHLAPGQVAQLLTDPQPLLTLDLDDPGIPDEVPARLSAQRTVTAPGHLDGCAVWFRAIFDEATVLSTSPLEPPTHWANRLLRTPQRTVQPGDRVEYRLDLPDVLRPGTWRLALDHVPATAAAS